MSVTLRRPQAAVTLDGTPLENVTGISVVAGYDRRTSEARITLAGERGAAALPTGAQPWQQLVASLGASGGTPAQRFSGFYIEPDWTLWPKSVVLVARGPLVLAQLTTCSDPNGVSYANFTDIQLVEAVLTACGISDMDIQGIGTVLGSFNPDAFVWRQGQSALDFLAQLDEVCLGWRVFETAAGVVVRRQVSITPAPSPAWTFAEGVDITSATAQATVIGARNRLAVQGAKLGDTTVEAVRVQPSASTVLPPGMVVTESRSSGMIERSQGSDAGPGIAAGDVAEWLMRQLNRQLVSIPMQTYRDDLVLPGQTVQINGPTRLGTDATYWVQSTTVELAASGGFTQHLICLGGPGSDAPIVAPPLVSFTLDVEEEQVVSGAGLATLTVVRARDTSVIQSGTLASRAWTVAGGGNPASGSEADFLTGFADIGADAAITLTISDSNGQTASRTLPVAPAAAAPKVRVLIVAEEDDMAIFTGAEWRTQVPDNGGLVIACGNAPLWSAGGAVYRSTDYLATPAPSSIPLEGERIFTLSATLGFQDISGERLPSSTVVAGDEFGQIAISRDGAQTWTVTDGPTGSTPIQGGASPYDAHQVQVVYPEGGWTSWNDGADWVPSFTPAAFETVTDAVFGPHTFGASFPGHFYALYGGSRFLVRAEDNQAVSFPAGLPSTGILAVTMGVAIDRLYAVDTEGHTYYTEPVGSLTMVQGADLPFPVADMQRTGMLRDSQYEGLIYLAGGPSGLWKSVDGLKSSGAYYPLRLPGVDNCPAGASIRMVGYGELLVPGLRPVSTASGLTAVGISLAHLGLSAPPPGWQNAGFDDSAWGVVGMGATTGLVGSPVSGTTAIWAFPTVAFDTGLMRQHVSLPLGTISRASFIYRGEDQLIGVWINGIFVGSQPAPSGTANYDHDWVYSVDPSILRPGADNVIAVQGKDFNGFRLWASWRLDIS